MRNIKPEVAARVTKFLNRLAKELPAAGKEKVHQAVRRIAELEGTSVNYYYVARSLDFFIEVLKEDGIVRSRATELVKGTFSREQVVEIIAEHRKRVKAAKQAKKEEPASGEPVQQQLQMNGVALTEATLEQIAAELRKRGYEGKLLKLTEVVV